MQKNKKRNGSLEAVNTDWLDDPLPEIVWNTSPFTEEEVRSILVDSIDIGISKALKKRFRKAGPFFDILGSRPDLMETYLKSQQTYAELKANEVVDIADDELFVDRAKTKIFARTWFSSKVLHKKYGDKLEVEHKGVVDIRGAIEEAKKRVAALDVEDAEVIEPKLLDEAGEKLLSTIVDLKNNAFDEECEEILDALPDEAKSIAMDKEAKEDDIFS